MFANFCLFFFTFEKNNPLKTHCNLTQRNYPGVIRVNDSSNRAKSIFLAAIEKHTPDEWMQKLGGVIPIAPVYNMAQGLDNPYVAQVGMIQTLNHPANPALRRLANPIKVDGARVPAKPAPPMGADTEPLLKTLGYDEAGIAKLKAAKAIA